MCVRVLVCSVVCLLSYNNVVDVLFCWCACVCSFVCVCLCACLCVFAVLLSYDAVVLLVCCVIVLLVCYDGVSLF